jgi:hypothetical protein
LPVGTNIAQHWQRKIFRKGEAVMKEFGNTLAQLFFIIMVMIVLAVSTATLSQWASSDASAATSDNSGIEQGTTAAPSLSAATTH